jgi:hypothetical protein
MTTRVNKTNRPKITNYIIKRLDTKSMEGKKKNSVSIIDIWDIQFETEKKFNVSEYMSQKLTWEIIQENNNEQ